MMKKAISLTLVATLVALLGIAGFAAPGGGRLPWSDYQKILRYQVMAPGVQVPEQEYMFRTTTPLTDKQLQELKKLGITLVAAVGDTVLVRGPITSFNGLGPKGTALPWVTSVTSNINLSTSDSENPDYYAISTNKLLARTGVAQLQSLGLNGEGVNIGIIDTGFTGELGKTLGSRVHYLKIGYSNPDKLAQPYITTGYAEGEHGAACAQAIASIAPKATFYLMSAPKYVDRKAFLDFIAHGKINIDVLSDSTYYSVPEDNNDGRGEIAQLADTVVENGIPYFYAIGNLASGKGTDRSFYAGKFIDTDRDKAYDFDTESRNKVDHNTLAITVDPWAGEGPVYLGIFLEWNGWPYDVKESSAPWHIKDLIAVQDLDLFLSYETPSGKVIDVSRSVRNQFAALDGGRNIYVTPQEGIGLKLDHPGTYLITVSNATMEHATPFRNAGLDPNQLFERSVDVHLYVYTTGTSFSIEHHTAAGSIINIAGAHNVIGVGAVGWTDNGWCAMDFSSQGPTTDGRLKPEIVAPNAYETHVFHDNPPYFSGTSASAPIAAGVAALLLQADPNLTPSQLLRVLGRSATQLCGQGCAINGSCISQSQSITSPFYGAHPRNCTVGYGLINAVAAYNALKALKNK